MRLSLLSFFMLLCLNVAAQTGSCKDSTLISPGYNCPNGLINYNPICGCDGSTYNNSCVAQITSGIGPGFYTEGPCKDFDFYFTPNTVTYLLEYNYYSKTSGIISILIYDPMGHVKYEYREPVQTVNSVVRDRYIDLQTLEEGIYLIVIFKDGQQYVKKFFRGEPY